MYLFPIYMELLIFSKTNRLRTNVRKTVSKRSTTDSLTCLSIYLEKCNVTILDSTGISIFVKRQAQEACAPDASPIA